MVCAALTPHGPKYIASAMDGVVPKFNVNVRRALEHLAGDRLVRVGDVARLVDRPEDRVEGEAAVRLGRGLLPVTSRRDRA